MTHSRRFRGSLVAVSGLVLATLLTFGFSAAALAEGDAEAAPKVKIGHKGFTVSSSDGRYMFDIGGRVQADYSHHFGSVTLQTPTDPADDPIYESNAPINGAELRRARIETKIRVGGDFVFLGDIGFADNKTGVKDFLLGYDGLDGFNIMIGNQKQPYSLVVEESSNDISFVERGIDSALVNRFADRAIGVRLEGKGDHFFVAGGVFGGSVSPDTTTDGWGFAGRAVLAPIKNDDTVLHLGFRTLYRQPSVDDPSVRIKDETTHHSSLSIVDTGEAGASAPAGPADLDGNFRDITMFGPEIALAWRFLQVKAEYNYAHTRRLTSESVALQSGHVMASFALTGQNWADAYKMSAGEFRRLKGAHDFDPGKGNWGDLELASRWAFIDLEDADVLGGREQAVSTSLIWSLNYNVRMMLDWTRIVKAEGPAWNDPVNATSKGLDMLTVRAQFAF